MFSDQNDGVPESDFSVSPLTPQPKRLHLPSRTFINVATILVAIGVLIAAAPWWTNVTLSLWQQVFPPPPYTGSLLFEDDGLTLTARATTDGRVSWRVGSIPQNSTFLRDGAILYVIPPGQQRLIALRISDGHQLWGQLIPPADVFTFVGSDRDRVYLTTRVNGQQNGNLFSFDKQAGRRGITVANISSAMIDPSTHLLGYCEELGDDHQITVMNPDAQPHLWQRVLPGSFCHVTLRNSLVIDDAFLPSQHLTHFVALNQETGTIIWQANVVGSPTYVSATTIIVESHPFGDPATLDSFTALDLASGAKLWSQTLRGVNTSLFSATPYAGGETIVLNTTSTGMLVVIDERTGSTLWTLPTITQTDNPQSWRAERDMTTLYFADQSQLRAVDLTTGLLRWRSAELADVPTSLVVLGQTVYETDGTQLFARDVQTGKIRWQQAISMGAQLCEWCNAEQ